MVMRFLLSLSSVFVLVLFSGCGTGIAQVQGATGPAGPPGLIYVGPYDSSKAYVSTDVVTYNGSSYVAVSGSSGVLPVGATGSAAAWNVLAQAGSTGAAGLKGDAGAQGVPGAQGVAGATGAIGPTGPTGAIGAAGPQGIAGVNPSAVSLSPWNGKVMVTFGDSIFAAYPIPADLAAALGVTLKFNDGVGGRTIAGMFSHYPHGVSDGTNTAKGNTLAQDLGGVDLVVIELTTNDSNTVLGSYSDSADSSSTATVAGSLRYDLETVRQANPTATVVFLTPYRSLFKYSQATYRTLRDLLKDVCDDYSVPLIDQTYNGISLSVGAFSGNLNVYLADGLHPSPRGITERIVPYLEQELRQYGPVIPQ